jgi:hypothetical protein
MAGTSPAMTCLLGDIVLYFEIKTKRAPGRYPGARITWNELASCEMPYCETVWITLLTGRLVATGILLPSLRTISSYSASVSS